MPGWTRDPPPRSPGGRPLRIFVNHLKTNFILDEFRLTAEELAAERKRIVERRTAQATAIRAILRHPATLDS